MQEHALLVCNGARYRIQALLLIAYPDYRLYSRKRILSLFNVDLYALPMDEEEDDKENRNKKETN